MHVRAPGKVNLALSVGPRREDGYHDLATVFMAVSLSEELHAHSAAEFSVGYTGPIDTSALTGDDTLVHRAARMIADELTPARRAELGVDDLPGLRIVVEKHVPIAGGMGGGSADAAAALLACDKAWNTGLSKERLWELGAQLGADVPFALQGGVALGTGRGDVLTPVLSSGEFAWVLVPSDGGLSTPAVYAELDRLRAAGLQLEPSAPGVDASIASALRDGNPRALVEALHNDMEAAAFSLAPELERRAARLSAHPLALRVVVSGSGPTLAVLTESRSAAEALAASLERDGQVAFVAIGPVAGAHFVHDTPAVDS